MHIHCIGLNHTTAGVALRERLAFSEEEARSTLERLASGEVSIASEIQELVILSTCNRVELYAIQPGADSWALEQLLVEARGIPRESFHGSLYHLLDRQAVIHLLRVAAGLDSQVIGEPQILGQVMKAFELAKSQNTTGQVLTRLFQAAVHAGRRARTETAINQNPASIASVAVRLAEQSLTSLNGRYIGVVGAGEMAELTVEAIRKRGEARIHVINRTKEKAQRLADRWGGDASAFETLPELLQQVDILITSTGAPHTILSRRMVAEAINGRDRRPLVIIDIAVPRDVEISAGELPGVRYFDIDQLFEQLETSLAHRAKEVPQVEAILEEEESAFEEHLRTREVLPVIAEMNRQAERIRLLELEKTLRRLPNLTPEERDRLDALTQALVRKILHAPITTLRQEAGSPQAEFFTAAVRELFGLPGDTGSSPEERFGPAPRLFD